MYRFGWRKELIMWFESLTGFKEKSPEYVRNNLEVRDKGETLVSLVNGRSMVSGRLETPSLAELRARLRELYLPQDYLRLSEVVADVQWLHRQPQNSGALFQVASQFNLLEMTSPSRTPEAGVGIYEYDHTQGPACAIACGAGTIYRNYFAEVNGKAGQTADNQIDCLRDLGAALGNQHGRLWAMENGYALPSAENLREIAARLAAAAETERDAIRQKLRIGIQWDTQVTLEGIPFFILVSQAYCSALPVSYSEHPEEPWAEFASLILEAEYEATLSVACLNYVNTGNNKVFLTLLGGGAFGNHDEWIFPAIERALRIFSGVGLDVVIVSYGSSNQRVQELIRNWR